MRINGKTFGEIWQDMVLPYRIVIVVGTAFLLFALVYLLLTFTAVAGSALQGEAGPLRVEAPLGNYLDPSLASDGQTVALAFSVITPTGISIQVASANTRDCSRFRGAVPVLADKTEALLAPDGTSELAQGIVRYETPSLVHDPADTAAPWKLFAYRYFWMDNIAYAQRYSMIVMRTATSPRGPWGREIWLLASAPDHPPPPYQGLVQGFINPLSPDLANVGGYTRPSVVAYRGALFMSLVTLLPDGRLDRVILLASLDRGQSWRYTGTLLTSRQVAGIKGLTRLAGASLLQRGDALYLAAVLGNDTTAALGTWLFRINDAATARLQTDDQGNITSALHLPLQSTQPTTQGGGYAAYTAACPDIGIVTAEHSGLRQTYTLFQTLQQPPN